MCMYCMCLLQVVRACPVPSSWENSNGSCKTPVTVKQEEDYYSTGRWSEYPAPPCTPVLRSCEVIQVEPVLSTAKELGFETISGLWIGFYMCTLSLSLILFLRLKIIWYSHFSTQPVIDFLIFNQPINDTILTNSNDTNSTKLLKIT